MAESSNPTQILSSPDVTPKKEPITLDRPESLNPSLPADQVEFNFDKITFTTNNEVALLYPEHPNSEYFQIVSDFILKCCLKEAFTRAPNQYKEYLSEFWFTTKTLEDSKIWVSTPTGGIRGDISITTIRNALRARDWDKRNSQKEFSSSKVEAINGLDHSVFRIVPSCCVIFDLEPLSLSFDFVLDFEISKYFP
ncbi:hypothetical protein Tco_0996039, partial [Tanacetum coccineum]